MKKRTIMMLVLSVAVTATAAGCGSGEKSASGTETTVAEVTTKEQTTETTEEVMTEGASAAEESSMSEETIADTTESDPETTFADTEAQKITLELDSSLTEIIKDEPYTAETDDGTFSFTITGLKKADWLTDDGKNVVLLCYEVSNQDYEPADGSLLLLNDTSFSLTDEYGNTLEASNSTKSEYGFPDFVEAGETKSQEQPYVLEQDSEKILVTYSRKNEKEANLILEVE